MPMVSFEEVRVYIQRDVDATVTKLLLDVFDVRVLLNQQTREDVPQVMKSYAPKSSRLQAGIEAPSEYLISHAVPCGFKMPTSGKVPLHGSFEMKSLFQLQQLGGKET